MSTARSVILVSGVPAREGAVRRGEREGDFLAGKYLLECCLGVGGMGDVYRATNVSLGRKVAIKILSRDLTHDEDDVLRFLREARAAAAVRHPNVVDVLDVARDEEGTPFIVQELLAGEDLEQYLRARRGRLSPEETLEIMTPVVSAIAAAHERDVVHRDLKPANIFLARDGNRITPKVLDFGACLFPTLAGASAREGRILIGTPHYMAPEQITDRAAVDARADVWALGVILYELLVGQPPFEADTPSQVLRLVKTSEVPSLRSTLPDVPLELQTLVAACTRRAPGERLESGGAVLERIEDVREIVRGSARRRIVDTPEAPDIGAPPSSARRAAAAATILEVTESEPRPATSGLLTLNFPDEDLPPVPVLDLPDATTPPLDDSRVDSVSRASAAARPLRGTPLPASIPGDVADVKRPSGLELVDVPRRSSLPPGRSSLPPVLTVPSLPQSSVTADRASEDAAAARFATASREAPRVERPARVARTWPVRERAVFFAVVFLPALVAFGVLRFFPDLTGPLARALRGDSVLGSGAMAVGALGLSAVAAAKGVARPRSVPFVVAAVGALSFGIVMIVVTFSSSEAAILGTQAVGAGLARYVAPIAPIALAFSAAARGVDAYRDRYNRREALVLAFLASVLLLLALEVSPLSSPFV